MKLLEMIDRILGDKKLRKHQKLILLTIARSANASGWAVCSLEDLAPKASMKPFELGQALEGLRRWNRLDIVDKFPGTNTYKFKLKLR